MNKKLKSNYDAILIPERPLELPQGTIYGLLYNEDFEMTYSAPIEGYLHYLCAVETWVRNGGRVSDGSDIWYHSDGIHSYEENYTFCRIITQLCKGMVGFRVLTFDKPITLAKGDADKCWVINPSLIDRIEKMEQTGQAQEIQRVEATTTH